MECGFKTAEYFARVFKKTEGMTSNQYRKRW
ncbi:AraC family transcriptional regulator [Lacticaseibacillus manihotivorans]|nr:AraC family transcriptional regulator [Lacticaseibacillus manihotivorans]